MDTETRLRIGIPGTDLVRFDALLAPDFEQSQYEDPAYPLERCGIYDAGSRAYDIPHYLEDLREYWSKVLALAEGGWSLGEALHERWPQGTLDHIPDLSSNALRELAARRVALFERLLAGGEA